MPIGPSANDKSKANFTFLAKPENAPKAPLAAPKSDVNSFVSRWNDGKGDPAKCKPFLDQFVRLLNNADTELKRIIADAKKDVAGAAAGGQANQADLQRITKIVTELGALIGYVKKKDTAKIKSSTALIDNTFIQITQHMMHDVQQAKNEWENSKRNFGVNNLTMVKSLLNSALAHHAR